MSLFGRHKSKNEKAKQQTTTSEGKMPEMPLASPLKAQKTIRILMLPIGEPPVVCTIEAHENTQDFKSSFDFLVNGKADLVYLCRKDISSMATTFSLDRRSLSQNSKMERIVT